MKAYIQTKQRRADATAQDLLTALIDLIALIEDGGLLDEFDSRNYRVDAAREAVTKAIGK